MTRAAADVELCRSRKRSPRVGAAAPLPSGSTESGGGGGEAEEEDEVWQVMGEGLRGVTVLVDKGRKIGFSILVERRSALGAMEEMELGRA